MKLEIFATDSILSSATVLSYGDTTMETTSVRNISMALLLYFSNITRSDDACGTVA